MFDLEELRRCRKYIEAHAKKVAEDGVYLELVDVMMFCWSRDFKLQLMVNSRKPLDTSRPAFDFVADLYQVPSLQRPVREAPQDAEPKTPKVFTIVITRADYQDTDNAWQLNHWMPCIEAPIKLTERLATISAFEKRERDSALAQLDADEEADDYQVQATMEYLSTVQYQSVNLKRLTTRIHHHTKLFPVAVRADGDCGVWSLLDMANESPWTEVLHRDPWENEVTEEWKQRMRDMRQEISAMWLNVLEPDGGGRATELAAFWWKVFRLMVLDAGGEARI